MTWLSRHSADVLGTHRASRRTVLTRSSQFGAAITGVAATGGLTSILASAKAPVYLQDSAPSGKVRVLYYGEPAAEEARYAEFSKAYPDIEVEVVGMPGDSWADFADACQHPDRRRREIRRAGDRHRGPAALRQPRPDQSDRRPAGARRRGDAGLLRRRPSEHARMVQHAQLPRRPNLLPAGRVQHDGHLVQPGGLRRGRGGRADRRVDLGRFHHHRHRPHQAGRGVRHARHRRASSPR